MCHSVLFFFFKQKTAYEMRISDWSSDVCSSDLEHGSVVPFLDVGCGGTTAAVTLLDRVQRKLAAMTRGLLGPHRSRPGGNRLAAARILRGVRDRKSVV